MPGYHDGWLQQAPSHARSHQRPPMELLTCCLQIYICFLLFAFYSSQTQHPASSQGDLGYLRVIRMLRLLRLVTLSPMQNRADQVYQVWVWHVFPLALRSCWWPFGDDSCCTFVHFVNFVLICSLGLWSISMRSDFPFLAVLRKLFKVALAAG